MSRVNLRFSVKNRIGESQWHNYFLYMQTNFEYIDLPCELTGSVNVFISSIQDFSTQTQRLIWVVSDVFTPAFSLPSILLRTFSLRVHFHSLHFCSLHFHSLTFLLPMHFHSLTISLPVHFHSLTFSLPVHFHSQTFSLLGQHREIYLFCDLVWSKCTNKSNM